MRYIGFSSHGIDKRWQKHVSLALRSANSLLACAIREFGQNAFEHDVICTVDTEKDAKVLERYYIEMLNTWGPLGYNMTRGGNGNGGALRGRKYSLEHCQKISQAHQGKVLSPGTRLKLSEIGSRRVGENHSMFGKHHSEQVRANMSKVKHDLYSTERGQEIKQQISETLTGRKLSEEHKSNVGKAGLGRRHTNEAIQKMKTHEFSDEHRRKLSEAAKRRKYI